jgi:hypothetical protein
MRPWTLLCVLIALVADLAAIILLLRGHDAAIVLVVIASAAAVTAGTGGLLVIQPRPAAEPSTEPPLPSVLAPPELPIPSLLAPEPLGSDPLDNKPWLKLVEENVALFDELDRHRADFDAPRQEVADHVICRLQEILERSGVDTIYGDANFDRSRHQPEGASRVLPGATVTETLSPGFQVGRRILRRARVHVQNPTTLDSSS